MQVVQTGAADGDPFCIRVDGDRGKGLAGPIGIRFDAGLRGFELQCFGLGFGRWLFADDSDHGGIRHIHFAGTVRRCFTARLQRVLDGVQQIPAGERFGRGRDVSHAALRHHATTTRARAGPDVDDVVGAANGVFVMLDHHQRVAALAELAERTQQNLVVARMQTDGRLVQHVANALQV